LASSWDKLIEDGRVVYGTPEMVVAQIERMAESGMEMLLGQFQFGELDFAASDRSLRLFCTEVLPKIRHLNARTPLVVPA
jgi:hypothetical protein